MKVALYVRVSTSDKDQNPETQLVPIREFVQPLGLVTFREYVDYASATDLLHWAQWHQLPEDASKRRFDLLLVWRMDWAFRLVLDAVIPLERLRSWGVGLRSYSEPWLDTTSPFGEALYYITIAYAQLERGILRERVEGGWKELEDKVRESADPRSPIRKAYQSVLEAFCSALSKEISPGGRRRRS
jgi:DNA invertase Pin-like site-specific DNA recombinase